MFGNRQERKERIALIQTGPVSFETGLNGLQVEKRKKLGLANVTGGRFSRSYFYIVMKNLFNWFNIVLLGVAAAFIAFRIGFPGESQYGITKYGFLIPVALNFTIGIVQEIRAKRVTDRLKILNVPRIKVIRDAQESIVKSTEVVTDDLIVLESGMQVPVDGTIVRGSVAVDESLLTGEQKERSRHVGDKILAGTVVVSGAAHMRAVKVGRDTYAQRLRAALAHETKPHSEMTRGVSVLVAAISVLIVPMAAISGFTAYQIDANLQDTVVQVGTTIVGAIPTGLVLLASGRCALSIIALFKEKTSVRELRSVEGLALSQMVCLDKTGTLTTGRMEIDGVDYLGFDNLEIEPYLSSLIAQVPDRSETIAALRKAYPNADPLRATKIVPFDSRIKYSGCTFREDPDTFYALGAPQFLLPADDPLLGRIARKAATGLRVLALVRRSTEGQSRPQPLALFFLKDQIRPSAPRIIAQLVAAGVGIRVISGDDPVTVAAIAKRIGIPNADKAVSMIGKDKWQAASLARNAVVFGRTNPEQKRDIVKAIQNQGFKVAMIIDALNDILAAKAADCSVCISHEGGASAAAQVADVTILDGDFGHMPAIIKEGRKSVNNMERAATLFLMKSFLALALAAFSPLFGHLPYSIEGLYLVTWFVTGIGGFLLGLEDSNDPVRGRFLKNVIAKSLPAGLFIFAGVVTIQALTLAGLLPYAVVYPHYGLTEPIGGLEGLPDMTWISFARFSELKSAAGPGLDNLLSSVFFVEEPLCILTASLGALAVMVKTCSPIDKFRLLCLAVSVVITIASLLLYPMYLLGADSIPDEWRLQFVPFYSHNSVLPVLLSIPMVWIWLLSFGLVAVPCYAVIAELCDRYVFRIKDRFELPLRIVDFRKDDSFKASFRNIVGEKNTDRPLR